MAIKNILDANHVQVNKFILLVVGLPPIRFTSVGAIESELDDIERPDRTRETGGRQKPGEFEVTQPAHHILERAAMEAWFEECQDPVSPTHKKTGTILARNQSDVVVMSYQLEGLKIMTRALPEFELDNDGEMAEITWTLTFDEVNVLV